MEVNELSLENWIKLEPKRSEHWKLMPVATVPSASCPSPYVYLSLVPSLSRS